MKTADPACDDNEPETWMGKTLAPVYDCFNNIEAYYAEHLQETLPIVTTSKPRSNSTSSKTTSSAKSSKASRYKKKLIQAKLLQHDLEIATRRDMEEQRLSDLQAENEARLRQIKAQAEAETQKLQKLNEDAMRRRRLKELEETVKRATLEAKLIKETEPLESLTRNGDKLFNHNKSQSEPSIPPASSPSIEIGTSQVTQLPITTADNKVLNKAITSNYKLYPVQSLSYPA